MTAATWLGTIRPSNARRNAMLLERMRTGDPRARDELLVTNLPLVCIVATEVWPNAPEEMEYGDLLTELIVMMVRAVDNFKEANGATFAGHVTMNLRLGIRRRWTKWSHSGMANQNQLAMLNSYMLLVRGANDMGRSTDPKTIAKLYDVPREYCDRMDRLMRLPKTVSMDEPVINPDLPHERAGASYSDLRTAPDDVHAIVEQLLEVRELVEAVSALAPLEQKVIAARFGQRRSLQSVAKELDCERIDVRVLERSALADLRQKLPSAALV